MRALLLLLLAAVAFAQPRRLLVLSIDGLDHRYLRDAARLGLKIPNLARLYREGERASGVVGVVPTVTWPSHTTMLTGVPPARHGVRGNRRPPAEGGDYYWDLSLVKVPTLWDAARAAGAKTAAITWPVTVTSAIDCNLPEFFRRRQGGAMDLASIAEKSTPGLIEKISRAYPSFPQQWMDDRTRTLALLYLLRYEQPVFLAVHFVDFDAEQHDTKPFSAASRAVLEYTDELLGRILEALPAGMAIAIVSDHGFAGVDRIVHLRAAGLAGDAEITSAWVCARDPAAANSLRGLPGIGRTIPPEEWKRFLPDAAPCLAAYEPADGFLFGSGASEIYTRPAESGVHGLWPGRPDYRSVYLLWRPGIRPRDLGEIDMLSLAGRFAAVLGWKFP
jgi:hypothetical protein